MTDSTMTLALRDHVLRTGFDLSLGKTHVAALVYIDVMIQASRRQGKSYIDHRTVADIGVRRTFSLFAAGARGCMERGLVEHAYAGRDKPFHRHYRITKAGRLVLGLLHEAGIYAEYADLLPSAEQIA